MNKYEVDDGNPHIIVDNERCQNCGERVCIFACPAGLYNENNGQIYVEWAGCFECGTCLAVCPKQALSWTYPRGGFGIIYRQG